jgi:hypothetical protein
MFIIQATRSQLLIIPNLVVKSFQILSDPSRSFQILPDPFRSFQILSDPFRSFQILSASPFNLQTRWVGCATDVAASSSNIALVIILLTKALELY